jgi:hypothetical protein
MKKQIIILALILISGISILRSQPVKGLKSADMKSIKSTGIDLTFTREGNNLAVSAKHLEGFEMTKPFLLKVRINFTGNTHTEFEAFTGAGAMTGQLKLELVNGSTGKSIELKPDRNGDFGAPADLNWEEFQITFNEFKLNGQTIGTGYKPRRN